jgi:cytochrome c556
MIPYRDSPTAEHAMRQSHTAWFWAIVALLSGTVSVAFAAKGTVPPPKFGRDVTELFTGDPLKMLGPGGPGAVQAVTNVAVPGGPGPAAPDTAPIAAGNLAWSKIISAENLEAEVKAQAPLVNEAIKTLPNFKGNGREKAQNAYSELAALFAVISQYDGDVRWKKDAIGLRNKFSQVSLNCKTSSDATYKEAKARSEDLAELLRGGTVDLPKGEGTDDLGTLISRPPLMKRMEEARANKLGPWTSDKGAFSKNKDALTREAQLLAMLAQIIKDPTFESGDDATYLKYAADLQAQCLELVEAIKTDNQSGAQSAVARISKSCDTCHGEYR